MNNENENMNSTYSPEEQNRMRINQRKAELEQQRFQQIEAKNQQKVDQQEATNKAAKVGMKAAANYFAPGVGGQAVDLASNTKAGKRIINRVGKKLNRIPGMGSKMDNLNKSGALDTLDSATNLIGGGAPSSAKPASSINANRGIPGNNLQGVVQPKELNQSSDLLNQNESESLKNDNNAMQSSQQINSNTNVNEEKEVESDAEAEKQNIKGIASKEAINFIKKHPELAIYIGLGILGILVIFVVFIIIFGFFSSITGEASGSSSTSSGSGQAASASVTDACEQITVPIDEFLESKGSSLDDFNQYIVNEVRKAGLGTREGVVTAAVSLIGGLCQNYQARLPYTMGGAHPANYYGIPTSPGNSCGNVGIWGSKINNGSGSRMCNYGPYYYSGPDCSGFVSWAIHNGGYKSVSLLAESFGSLGSTHSMAGFSGKPGDILFNSHHVVMIVGEEGNNYLIAEASSGENGTRITTEPKASGRYTVVDMTEFYNNDANKISDYPEGTSSSSMSSSSSSNNNSIIIGDSRTVMTCKDYGLCQNDQYVAKVSMGYNWLVETAINETNNILNNNSGTKYNIYINLGANDYDYQANNYLNKINELATSTWKDHNIIFVTVNPMSDENENAKIESFNNTIKSSLNSSVKYCDTYTKIKSSGYNATDGTHYDKDTSAKIYEYMKGC